MWQATKCAVSAQKSSSRKNVCVCVQNTAVFMFCWAAEFHLQVRVLSANCGKSAQNRFGSTEAKCSLSCLLISAEHIESVACSLEFQTDSLQLFALRAHTHYWFETCTPVEFSEGKKQLQWVLLLSVKCYFKKFFFLMLLIIIFNICVLG